MHARCNNGERPRKRIALAFATLLCAWSAFAAEPEPGGEPALETRHGLATFYARSLHGRETASGEAFDRRAMVAAHPHYPLGTRVRVTHARNGRWTEVRINDRGPTRTHRRKGVIIDLSPAAAAKIGMLQAGRARVRVEVLEWGEKGRR